MRKMGIIIILFLVLFPFRVSGEQSEILNLLKTYEEEWNKKNVDGVISCFQDQAIIRTGQDRRVVSKADYKEYLRARFDQFGKLKLGKPSITDQGNKATVKVEASYQGRRGQQVQFVFKLLKDNSGRWLIVDQNY
jgi:ketosteroid isomerase-like protein